MTSMNNYLRQLLETLNQLGQPAQPQQEGFVGPQKTRATVGEPQFEQGSQQNPMQVPGLSVQVGGQQDPTSQAIMQQPNPNMPPSLPQQQADAQGQPSSPGNPGYIGPFANPQGQQSPQDALAQIVHAIQQPQHAMNSMGEPAKPGPEMYGAPDAQGKYPPGKGLPAQQQQMEVPGITIQIPHHMTKAVLEHVLNKKPEKSKKDDR